MATKKDPNRKHVKPLAVSMAYGELTLYTRGERTKSEEDFERVCNGDFATKHHNCAGPGCDRKIFDSEGWNEYAETHARPTCLTSFTYECGEFLNKDGMLDYIKKTPLEDRLPNETVPSKVHIRKGHKYPDGKNVWIQPRYDGYLYVWNINPTKKAQKANFEAKESDFKKKCDCSERCQMLVNDTAAYDDAYKAWKWKHRAICLADLCEVMGQQFPEFEPLQDRARKAYRKWCDEGQVGRKPNPRATKWNVLIEPDIEKAAG